MHRIVIKVGTNVLTMPSGKIDITRMSSLVDEIAWLRSQRYEVVLVSSGAVACGRGELRPAYDLDTIEQRQLYSAMGQAKLMRLYYDLFREYGIHIGQVLTMKENFVSPEQLRNQRTCMELMLDNGVLPIVNENDTVCLTELMFTDNDELSGLIAEMLGAETLVLLSNIDGVYTGNPAESTSRLIRTVAPGDDLSQYIQEAHSSGGRGGMQSKYATARTAAANGIRVVIANGKREHILQSLIADPDNTPHTEFQKNKK